MRKQLPMLRKCLQSCRFRLKSALLPSSAASRYHIRIKGDDSSSGAGGSGAAGSKAAGSQGVLVGS